MDQLPCQAGVTLAPGITSHALIGGSSSGSPTSLNSGVRVCHRVTSLAGGFRAGPPGPDRPGNSRMRARLSRRARPAPQLGVRGTPTAQCGINRSAVLGDSQSHMSPGSRSAPAIMAGAATQAYSMRLAGAALRSALQPHLLEHVGESRVTGGGLKRSELVEQHAQIGIALRTRLLRPGRVPSCPQGHVHPE